MAKEIHSQLTVRSYEVDIYGHVNNATYLNYLEFARVRALQQTGKSFVDYVKENIFIVIAQANLTFAILPLLAMNWKLSVLWRRLAGRVWFYDRIFSIALHITSRLLRKLPWYF